MDWTGRSLRERMLGAAMLRPAVYREIETDPGATGQAALVVALASMAASVGGIRAGMGALAFVVAAFLGWLFWSAVAFLIGTRLLGGTATWGELLRTMGFAQSPGILYVLGAIPFLDALVRVGVWIWIVVAVIVAIRQALNFDTARAVATALLGGLAYLILTLLAYLVLRVPAGVV